MFGGEPSKHNDEIKVKVSKLWKLFTATKPRTQGCGAPEYLILKSVLESYMYLEEGFKIKDIASLLFVSESTV